jgi:hypothetical protein
MEATQSGKVLKCFKWSIVHANSRFEPVQMIKVDLANSFYRLWIKATNVINLGVSFTILNGKELLIAFPIVQPMGWTNLPPWFSSSTETIANIVNLHIIKWRNPPVHRLETQASTKPPPLPAEPATSS